MNNYMKSATVHHHIHYHYHVDVDNQPNLTGQKAFSKSFIPERKDEMDGSRLTWKNHIDPKMSRIYDEMYQNEPFREERSPRASAYFLYKRTSSRQDFPSFQNEYSQSIHSRADLIDQMEIYEEYLKKRKVPIQYSSNKIYQFREGMDDTLNPEKYQVIAPSSTSLEDVISKNADSKIFLTQKMDQSTKAGSSEIKMKQSYFGGFRNKKKLIAQSEMKIAEIEGSLLKTKNTESQILKPSTHLKFQNGNEEFSVYTKQTEEASEIKPKLLTYRSLSTLWSDKQVAQTKTQDELQEEKNFKNPEMMIGSYKYDLVKEECEFLRTKFIEHIEESHGIKI